MTIKTCRNENEKYIIDAIIKTFNIDPDKISIKGWGWNYLLLERKDREYEICSFTEDCEEITIHLNKYGFKDAGLLREITEESAETIANNIKEKSHTNKKIYVYEIESEVLEEWGVYSRNRLYPTLQELRRK